VDTLRKGDNDDKNNNNNNDDFLTDILWRK
jgi:hypothetical protein